MRGYRCISINHSILIKFNLFIKINFRYDDKISLKQLVRAFHRFMSRYDHRKQNILYNVIMEEKFEFYVCGNFSLIRNWNQIAK